MLKRLLDEESGRVEGFVGTVFEETETNTTLYGNEDVVDDDLLLPDRPVVDVASIDADGTTLEAGADVRVRETHLELRDGAPIREWPDGPVEVEYSYGYDSAPGAVRDAIVRLVRSRLERIKSDGLESESLPTGQSASYRPPEEVMAAAAAAVEEHHPPSYFGGAQVI